MDTLHWPRCSRGANLRGDDEAKPTTLQHTCRCVCFSSRGRCAGSLVAAQGSISTAERLQKRKAVANTVHVVGVGVTKLEKLGT